jgi:glycosyltransferase involved in cell wall biosynthesis
VRLGVAERVRFTGAVPHAEVPAMLAELDVAVAPYLPIEDFYFMPLKVVEYLAAGKPVIYSDQGDIRALVADAGMGYAPGSASELADRLTIVLGDPARRIAMAARAWDRGAALDWSAVADRLVRFAVAGFDRGADATAGLVGT